MADPPSGTVTLFFSDIEGSTRLLKQSGDAWAQLLADHRRILRDAFRSHRGFEVDGEGDAFFVAFASANDAVAAAAEAQRALASHPWPDGKVVRVRMGLHTGEPRPIDGRYVGLAVHQAARVMAAGHGGQVLVSESTRALLDDRVRLHDLGEHRLKDLSGAQRLYQLEVEGLPMEFPPLKTLENLPTNLPTQLTPLVGREQELREIAALVRRDEVRLVTATGLGGTGKTRLALQAGVELLDDFPSGVFFVPLASLTEPALVIPAVAEAFGIDETLGQSLRGYLAGKRVLLVVDNLEQVIGAAPQLAELLAATEGLKMIATSREPLRITGEHVYAVPPLPASDAVTLFRERAQAVQHDFDLTSDNIGAVTAICDRLDGLPLAIELAAARISTLSPEAMLPRLGERLKLLRSGARDLPERQRTLRQTLSWSFDLLAEEEQALFASLAVFVGGFTLEAAEAVCDAEVDVLASLVEKSLVRHSGERYTMLETVREFAREQSALAPGNLDDRHAAYYLALAEEAYVARLENETPVAARLTSDHDNFRAAIDYLQGANPRDELRLTGALGWFWRGRSHMAEGRIRLTAALERGTERSADLARALGAFGSIAAWQGDLEAARPALEQAIEFWHESGNAVEEGLACEQLAWAYFYGGDDPSARTSGERSVEVLRRHGDERLLIRAQLAVCQVLVSQGELEVAEPIAHEALAVAESHDDDWAIHLAHHFLADCALIREDYDLAELRYARALRAALAHWSEILFELQGVAMAASGRAQPERALRLAGAASAELDALGVDISGITFWIALQEKNFGRARDALGEERATAVWENGRQLPLERAVEEALAPWPDA
jgi:predicted ATPase/class 3 adenylate cyclase